MSSKKLAFLLIVGLFLNASSTQAAVNNPNNGGGNGSDPNNSVNIGPKTYALLIGSNALSAGITNAIRGNLDVDNVASQLSWATSVVKLNYNWNDAKDFTSELQSAAANFASQVKPGDSFIFYYSGHGIGGPGEGVQDFLNPMNGVNYQDNSLASIFSDSLFGDVKKMFIVDCCHAEGIWKNDSADDKDLQTLHNISFLGSSSEESVAYSDTANNGTSIFTNAILSSLKPNATFGNLLMTAMATSGSQVTGYFKDDGFGTGPMTPVSFYSDDFDLGGTLGGQSVPEPATLTLVFAGAAFAFLWRRRRG